MLDANFSELSKVLVGEQLSKLNETVSTGVEVPVELATTIRLGKCIAFAKMLSTGIWNGCNVRTWTTPCAVCGALNMLVVGGSFSMLHSIEGGVLFYVGGCVVKCREKKCDGPLLITVIVVVEAACCQLAKNRRH